MKKLTIDDVMTALRANASAEPDGDRIVYYLHLPSETFSVSHDLNDYFGLETDADYDRIYDGDYGAACVAVEDDPDSDFCSIAAELTAQANVWLATLDDDDAAEEVHGFLAAVSEDADRMGDSRPSQPNPYLAAAKEADESAEPVKDIDSSAAALYDGGWRADDRNQLIAEYHLRPEDADAICKRLAELDDESIEDELWAD